MIKFIVYLLLVYLIDIILVGVLFAAIKKAFKIKLTPVLSLLMLMIEFAAFDNYMNPLVNLLDVTFTIHNQEITNFFNLKANEPISNFLAIDYFDFIVWFSESLIALFIIDKRITRRLNAI